MTPAGLPDSIAGLRAELLTGEVGVGEALRAQRAALVDDPWHCVVDLLPAQPDPDVALPLAGVGLAHKDIFVLPGHTPYCGAGHPWRGAAQPSPVVARLSTVGSAPLATLVMAEHACGATGENPYHPLPLNPLDAHAAVGGSSSGCAVAVAAGLCYASLGTDTAGSVRIPAATCGVVGLKPTRGLLSLVGVAPLAPSLDTVGVIARRAEDVAITLAEVQGSAQTLWEDAVPNAGAWRVAACYVHPDAAVGLDGAVVGTLEEYASECAQHGRRRDVVLSVLADTSPLTRIFHRVVIFGADRVFWA